MRRVAEERGSTYVFVGTPDERPRVEILRGSLVSRMVRELPGIDIRVIADRALREERPDMRLWRRKAARATRRAAAAARPVRRRALDPAVLAGGDPIARAEEAILVAAYLVVVPLEFDVEAPLQQEAEGAMPLLEAVEHAAARAGVPVDARIERGRTPIDALSRLWEVESFDRILVPARAPGHPGFSAKDLAWMLAHAPSETLVLRPAPEDGGSVDAG